MLIIIQACLERVKSAKVCPKQSMLKHKDAVNSHNLEKNSIT